MTSLPVPMSFKVGSTMSAASSVRDVIASYRRAQYFVAGSTHVSTQADDELILSDEEDEEARLGRFDEYDENDYYVDRTPNVVVQGSSLSEDDFVNQLEWDEDLVASDSTTPTTVLKQLPGTPVPPGLRLGTPSSHPGPGVPASLGVRFGTTPAYPRSGTPASLGVRWDAPPSPPIQETTPLLSRKVSVSFDVPPSQVPRRMPIAKCGDQTQPTDLGAPSSTVQRRLSNASIAKSVRSIRSTRHVGQSTFGQTLFNSIAILLGIGMLSEPLAFAYSGWFMGTVLISMYGVLACYTAKILARIICSDPQLRTYSDIGRKAFGPRATVFISSMFCLELFAVSVILVTLYADSLHTLIPTYSANMYKVWGLLLLIPTVFLPLSLLSYTSILGILSTVLLVFVVLIDGAFKKESPGSFWDPAETTFGAASMSKLGVAFGLFMAGFAGHAVVPSLARDMIDPTEFDKMINWAFVVATVIYSLIGYTGYLMYGNNVSDEISMDMLKTPGFNPLLNQAALWMLVLNPLSKFALNTRPLMSTSEILMGLDLPERCIQKSEGATQVSVSRTKLRKTFVSLQRIALTCASVAVSIYIPEFSVMMAFLGSFSAFCLSIVGPIAAKVKIEGKCSVFDAVIMLTGTIMAIWGTFAAFMD
ncbi:Vacuolar amino acid transporter 1 [Leucoagaricus sp. SymC.cos]|nr:Vacuolar amino acid transporter 1 [Leucoagaricus sp. SymC.cos]